MGEGTISSFRWHEDRKVSASQMATFWENNYQKMKNERDYFMSQCERLAEKVVQRDKLLTQYRSCFGELDFKTPDDSCVEEL